LSVCLSVTFICPTQPVGKLVLITNKKIVYELSIGTKIGDLE